MQPAALRQAERRVQPVGLREFLLVVADPGKDFDAAVRHFQTLFDAEFFLDIPQAEWHAGLLAIGGVVIELFMPHDWLLTARIGPHYLGVEYQAEMETVRAAIDAQGLRIVRDIGAALHTHPADGHGVAYEFYAGTFHDRAWPLIGGRYKPAEWWRDHHPLGLTGLDAISAVVEDLEAAGAFLQRFLGAEPTYRTGREGAEVAGFRVAGSTYELMAPAGPGPIADHLRRLGQGIRSTRFGIRDLDLARRWFGERGVGLVAGDAPGTLAIQAEANLGLLFEFVETCPPRSP